MSKVKVNFFQREQNQLTQVLINFRGCSHGLSEVVSEEEVDKLSDIEESILKAIRSIDQYNAYANK